MFVSNSVRILRFTSASCRNSYHLNCYAWNCWMTSEHLTTRKQNARNCGRLSKSTAV